jgi:hypothetical protein
LISEQKGQGMCRVYYTISVGACNPCSPSLSPNDTAPGAQDDDGSSSDGGGASDDDRRAEGGAGSGKLPQSRAVQMLQARELAAAAADKGGAQKRKGRDDGGSDGSDDGDGGGRGKRLATGAAGTGEGSHPPAASTASSAVSAAAAASGGLSGVSISEREVRAVLEQANGRMKTVDLKNRFKKRIKASEAARKEFIAVLHHLVVIEENEVEGRMYVLKGRQFS